MSALTGLNSAELASLGFSYPTMPSWWLEALAMIFYKWADANRHVVVIKKKLLIFTVTITVGDCERLIEFLIGPRPDAAVGIGARVSAASTAIMDGPHG